jgi:hypothetical protein
MFGSLHRVLCRLSRCKSGSPTCIRGKATRERSWLCKLASAPSASRFTTALLAYLSYLAHLPAPLLRWRRHLPRRAAGARGRGGVRGGAPPLGWPLPLHPLNSAMQRRQPWRITGREAMSIGKVGWRKSSPGGRLWRTSHPVAPPLSSPPPELH